MNDRVCDASIRSMLEEFQILNSIFRLVYEYHLDLCNELNCRPRVASIILRKIGGQIHEVGGQYFDCPKLF